MSKYLTDLQIKDYKIYQDTEDYAFTQDSVFLANIAKFKKDDYLIDLGSGCGILSFLAVIKQGVSKVVGIEIQHSMVSLANESIVLNKLENKISIIEGDVKNIKNLVEAESFDKAICNPPYFVGEKSTKKNLSHIENSATLEDFVKAAAYSLKFGGDLYIVIKENRLSELLTILSNNKLEPKEMTLVYPKLSSGIDIAIIKARKGAKVGLQTNTLIVKDEDGNYTKEYEELYV